VTKEVFATAILAQVSEMMRVGHLSAQISAPSILNLILMTPYCSEVSHSFQWTTPQINNDAVQAQKSGEAGKQSLTKHQAR
jgi:hypothetical protein